MKQCFIINLAYSIILFISLEWLSVSFYIYDQLLKMLRFKPKSTLLMQVQCSLCNDQNTLSSFFKVSRKKCMFSNSKEVFEYFGYRFNMYKIESNFNQLQESLNVTSCWHNSLISEHQQYKLLWIR